MTRRIHGSSLAENGQPQGAAAGHFRIIHGPPGGSVGNKSPVINGISRVNPLITGDISYLLSGMIHQALIDGLAISVAGGENMNHLYTYLFSHHFSTCLTFL